MKEKADFLAREIVFSVTLWERSVALKEASRTPAGGLALPERCSLDVLFGRPCITKVKHTVTQCLSAEVTDSVIQRKTRYIFIPPAGKVHALPFCRAESGSLTQLQAADTPENSKVLVRRDLMQPGAVQSVLTLL